MTSRDIAMIAGVSQATVSRCLNNSPLVKEETKERVLEIVRKYNFTFNANAKSLKTNKTGTVGIVFPEHFVDFNVNMYFADLFNYLRTNLDRNNYDLLALNLTEDRGSMSNVERVIRNKKVDGLIRLQSYASAEADPIFHSIPTVYIDDGFTHTCNSVCVDHFKAGYLVGSFFAEKGMQSIGCITIDDNVVTITERTRGFMTSLQEADMQLDNSRFLYGDLTYDSGLQVVKNHIDRIKEFDAIFVQNDVMAMGVINGLRSFGIRVPEDVSIIGYDDLTISNWFYPSLTTVHIPNEEISNQSCSMLFDLLEEKDRASENVMVSPELVERDSTT